MLTYYSTDKDKAREFFRNEHLFEVSRIDGKDMDDMLIALCEDQEFIVTEIDSKIVAITSFKEHSHFSFCADVHTYVLPSYKMEAVSILEGHLEWFKSNLFLYIFTMSSDDNKATTNFLTKRLGFSVISAHKYESVTKDGKPITIYNLYKGLL